MNSQIAGKSSAAANLSKSFEADKQSVSAKSVTIVTDDQYSIHATLFRKSKGSRPQCAVVFNCGAGISAKYYGRFARYLAANDIPTLTYDYRGIGASRVGPLRDFVASVEDWAELDCASAIRYMTDRFEMPVYGISHSIGALIFGGAFNASSLAGLAMIAPHTGYVGDYRRAYQVPMALVWHGVMPLITTVVGYFPGRRLHLGEDIPAGIAMQWARRRGPTPGPNADQRTKTFMTRLAELELPALSVTLSDDGFATLKGAERIRSYFANMSITSVVLTPKQAHVKRLGHFGFFRAAAEPTLWPIVANHLRVSANTHADYNTETDKLPTLRVERSPVNFQGPA